LPHNIYLLPSFPGIENFFFLLTHWYPDLNLNICTFYLTSPFTPFATMSKTFSAEDVATQGKGASTWVIIDEDVYDVSKFQDEHPGKFFKFMRANA
jgi:cytochrome b involved in lipid metabolism